MPQERSPELLALDEKYAALQKSSAQCSPAQEPSNGSGISIAEFVDLTGKVADGYEPSGYLKSAPYRKA